ncbi:ABC transporter substrate-binding protein [Gordoniibacillus kamchatkensis]|uniref:ABC transporter substrate-binding protein n=1 Tax=Gordoniibacillus kamchatkensis TaxID=1590651 RepID=A0ABR5AH68_9BACL|nr:extracellular solute-binding protein [Paenibacillus sp. VKM B-2647]KIL40410.1 ABC transporter substrate-binding protein [Paenibacillus sp. VKM B-2647]
MARRLWTLASVFTLSASLVAGCSGGAKQQSETAPGTPSPPASSAPAGAAAPNYGDTGGIKLPIVDKPTTLTWMLVSENPNPNDSMIVKEIEKRTGIHLELQAYPSASFQDKLKVVVASGKLPDIFHGLPLAELNKMGGQGALEPINAHLGELPNFKKLYVDNKDNNWIMKSWTDDKGNLYTWPIYNLQRDVNHGILYRKDIWDKLGLKEWNGPDEFYQDLKKVKEAYPQSYPFASKTKEAIFTNLAYGWGIGGASSPAFYDEKDKTWKLQYTQQEYKDELDYLKKLYNEGLLDPEFITDTDASWTAKMTNDKAFVTWDWIGRLDLFANQVKTQNPNYNLRYGNPIGPTGRITTLPRIDNFGITVANNKNKDIALKLLDYLTSPSGAELVTMGVEGQTFKMENGKPVYPELKDVPTVDITALDKKYGLWMEGMYLKPDHRSVYYNFTEKEKEAQDKMLSGKRFEPADPVLKFTNDEIKVQADVRTTLVKAANEFSAKYVIKKDYGDAQWKDWVQNVEKLGASKYIDTFNAAQKRFDAAK